ncbi:MAG: EamA family transporter [Desulfovibrionaceae bacterium]|nr:EamA family transporter [Desulfovibrionaceae bacterium]
MQHSIWPLLLVVGSNILYNICTKETPTRVNPFAALALTYSIAALSSVILYFILRTDNSFWNNMANINWAPPLLGVCIVGLELGYILMYRSGWPVNIGSLTANITLAVLLVAIGYVFYHEHLTGEKIIGMLLCLCGLVFLIR